MYLFHNYKRPIAVLDAEGRTYNIEPNKPWEVPLIRGTDCKGTEAYVPFVTPTNKVAEMLCKEGIHYGLVVVPEVRTETGIQFDLKAAALNSAQVRKGAEDHILERYIKGAKEDELAKIPVKPPSASIAAILDARGLDLKRDYGLSPVGYRVSEGAAARDAEMEALRNENREIKEMLSELLADRKSKREKVTA